MSHSDSSDPAQTTDGCRYCWMCRQSCPVGHVTSRETLTPHAWALLIESVKRGVIAWNAETADVLYQCADCGLCQSHCATDRPLPQAIALARAEVAAAGLAPAAVYALRDALQADARRSTPAAAGAARAGDVALFVGTHGRRHAAAVDAASRLLAAAGIATVRIGEGCDTGALASTLGFPDIARAQAEAAIAAVTAAGVREVLVFGPGDRYAFERLFSERLGVAWPDGVTVREVTAALADSLAKGALRIGFRAGAGDYAYHDPCHTTRVHRDHAQPRALLAAALGDDRARRMFWREDRAHPCGSVGALAHTHPALADRLSDARLADAAAGGATVLVTDDPSCLEHLQSRRASGVSVVGLYELLADRLAN